MCTHTQINTHEILTKPAGLLHQPITHSNALSLFNGLVNIWLNSKAGIKTVPADGMSIETLYNM